MASFYLKYRPQTFADLDNRLAREELVKIFKTQAVPHAFLFTGPRGIGKTSAARIVAKAVNCPNKQKSFEPCNQCPSCQTITAGNQVDVLEIDAASNRGIDDVRELRERIKLAPTALKYKLYIVDEVHMLTTEGFNALLKTLEEPPKHALFILCTTDPAKLPKTIISRCQLIHFRQGTREETVARLEKICLAEKIKFDQEALAAIYRLSEGSFRDAVKILEQASYSGEVSQTVVEQIAGINADFPPRGLLRLLAKRRTKEALAWLGQAVKSEVNLKLLTQNLLDLLRRLLLRHYGVAEVSGSEDEPLTVAEIRSLVKLFTQAYLEMRHAPILVLPLEMAVVEWEQADNSDSQPGFTKAVATDKPTGGITLEEITAKWPAILEKVKPMNHSVVAFLRASRPRSFAADGFLTLEVFYKFHKDQLETEKCRRIFEGVASAVLERPVKLRCVLSGVKSSGSSSPVDEPPLIQADLPGDDQEDIIKLAEEIFNGRTPQ